MDCSVHTELVCAYNHTFYVSHLLVNTSDYFDWKYLKYNDDENNNRTYKFI